MNKQLILIITLLTLGHAMSTHAFWRSVSSVFSRPFSRITLRMPQVVKLPLYSMPFTRMMHKSPVSPVNTRFTFPKFLWANSVRRVACAMAITARTGAGYVYQATRAHCASVENNQTIIIKKEKWEPGDHPNLKNYLHLTAYDTTGKSMGSMSVSLFGYPTVHIDGISVNAETRKQGIGRMMMCSSGYWIPELAEVTLNANEEAVPFYKKIGLVEYRSSSECLKWTKQACESEMSKFTFERIDDNTVRVSKR